MYMYVNKCVELVQWGIALIENVCIIKCTFNSSSQFKSVKSV